MDKVTIYSNDCPKCNVLKRKLDEGGITYSENHDEEKMKEMGITQVPMLEVGADLMDFSEAMKWINN